MPRVPLLRVVVPFVLGILLEDVLRLAPAVCGVTAVLGLGLWRLRPAGLLAGSGEILLGIGLGALALAPRLAAPIPSAAPGPTVLTLLQAPSRSSVGCRLSVHVHGPSEGRARLGADSEACELLPGALAVARIELEPLSPATNPGGSSRRDYWARRGVQAGGRVRGSILPVSARGASFRARLERARRALGESLDPADRPSRAGALLRALATGERSFLGDGVRRSFSRAGTAHLLAVSGLHVGWVLAVGRAASGWLIRRSPGLFLLRRANALSLGVGAFCALGYALLTGPAIPALRASSMAFAGTLAVLGGRPAASWNALALALLTVLAIEPASLFEPALLLSFAAVSGIVVWRPEPGMLPALLHSTLAAVLATAPFIASLGAPLPVAGLCANLIVVPLFGVALVPLALVAAGTATLLPALAGPPLWIATRVAELGIRLVELLESPDLLAVAGDRVTFALGLAGCGFGFRLLAGGQRRLAGALLIAAPLALGVGLISGRANTNVATSLVFLDVGHGDSVLLRSGRAAWLIDAGPRLAGFDAGRYVVLPALRAEGVRRLNALILTHSDRDHIGGAEAVVRGITVDELWMSRETLAASASQRVRREAARAGVPIRVIAAGDAWYADALSMRALWPPAGRVRGSSNRSSLVLEIRAGRVCAMLPGDIPAEVERVLASHVQPCEILKLAHHGSGSSTADSWLRALAPEIAVVSAGRRRRHPLPDPEVRSRVRRAGIALWETSRCGAVRIDLGGARPSVRSFLASHEAWRGMRDADQQSSERPGEARSTSTKAARSPPSASSCVAKQDRSPR